MQGQLHQYKIIKDLAKKYSHSTYLAAPADEPERRVVLVVFSSLLFSAPHEREVVLGKARSLKKLQHAHLVPLLDMGIADEQPFVVREYVPNQSLRSYLKQLAPERLELRDALTLLLQVGEALVHAHSHQIFHGNIKPENILLDAHGDAYLTDFTLLKRADAMIRDQTSEEYAFCYQAPEQFAGTWGALSDQYALGCLTYELITGQVPFVTQTLTSMIGGQGRSTQLVPPFEKVPNLSPSLDVAVLKALAEDPSDRFSDFSLFLEVIRAVAPASHVFPFSHHKTADSRKAHSRLVQPPKPPAVLASTREEAAPAYPLSQRLNASSAIDLDESERAEQFINGIFKEEDAETANMQKSRDVYANDAFTLGSLEEDAEAAFMLGSLENEEMAEALLIDIDEVKPLTKRAPTHRKLFLGIILVCLIIAASSSYAVSSIRGTDKPVPPVGISTILIQQDTPAGTQFSLPISSRIALQPTQSADIQPKTNVTPQSIPSPTPTPTPTTPTPTPTPTPVPHQTTTIDDSVQGAGNNQFNYVGSGWHHMLNTCKSDPCEYNTGNSWDNISNDYVTLTFTGVQLRFYGVIDSMQGIGAVSMDGGSETMINFYAANRAGNQLLWTSPTLPEGTHTFKLRVTGTKDSRSSNTFVAVDRVDVIG